MPAKRIPSPAPEFRQMLAVETADDKLYVPEWEIASITPVYPGRCRIVLADGTVAHRPGDLPAGPWIQLGDSWVTPSTLTRESDYWRDPADYLYPYQPLPEPAPFQPEGEGLPPGLLTLETRNRQWFWRTDSEELPCDLKPDQVPQLYPQLCLVNRGQFVNTLRVRRFGSKSSGGWLDLDNGQRISVSQAYYTSVASALGCDSLDCLDSQQPPVLPRLRDFPYDLTQADPDRIRRDCPTPVSFVYNLLWQTLLQHHHGQVNDYGRDIPSFARHPLAQAGQRCGYALGKQNLENALDLLVYDQAVILLSQLGFEETDPQRRLLGARRPQVVLLAPLQHKALARQAAQDLGISLLLSNRQDQLPLEHLAAQLKSPLQLLAWSLDRDYALRLRDKFEDLERTCLGPPVLLSDLSQLAQALQDLPALWVARSSGFRRVPLEAESGLVFVSPHEIACWSPSCLSRYRVVLADGRLFHHPGPVPSGPWVPLEEHWVGPNHLKQEGDCWVDPAGFRLPYHPLAQPASLAEPVGAGGPGLPCPPEQILWLEQRDGAAFWHLEGGRQVASPLAFEVAASHHPDLTRLSRFAQINHNRLHSSAIRGNYSRICLDEGQQFTIQPTLALARLKEKLALPSLSEIGPDLLGLRWLQLRDYPYEIARADARRLRSDFSGLSQLILNVLWQAYQVRLKTGQNAYADTFSGFFYRPLQAILYRAGYLTRAQWRAPARPYSAKDQIHQRFCNLLTNMVYRRLFSYRQFGFKDASPEKRIIGCLRPHQILLVEKGDRLEANARRLQQKWGMSLMLLGGMPSLLASEYFVEHLRQHWPGPVEIYFYGDFDDAGWDIGPAFRHQLKFLGCDCTRLERLVLASCFAPEEQALCSRPLPIATAGAVTRLARWVKESGGVNGQARGIHANWLQPYERVQARMEELLSC